MDESTVKRLAREAFWVALVGFAVGMILLSPMWRKCCSGFGDRFSDALIPAFVVSIVMTDEVKPISFVAGVVVQFLGLWYPVRLAWLMFFPPKPRRGRAAAPYQPEHY